MNSKFGDDASFVRMGLAPRNTFSHYAILIPKAYPDSRLLLERRGISDRVLKTGVFYQLNLYTSEFYGLPDELFTDPEINWHRQQFGQKGLVASAGLWARGSRMIISTLQSDLCQQLHRHRQLGRSYKTRVETRFKYWRRLLFNAVMDACLDGDIGVLYSPTGRQIVAHTRKRIEPGLFHRIYDTPTDEYECQRILHQGSEYWKIPIKRNAARIVRLRLDSLSAANVVPTRGICVFHDIEENIDTAISAAECQRNLERMLRIELEFGLSATYCILGKIFDRARNLILDSNRYHAIGFHSADHNLARMDQLPRCRDIDLRVRGYRPPKSQITRELTDENLTYHNFEWLASSSRSFGYNDGILQNGIVKIPIHQDDHSLFAGRKDYAQWESELLERVRSSPLVGFSLHDCYAGRWLDRYPALLEKLSRLGKFATADEVSDRMYLAAASAVLANKSRPARGFGLVRRMAPWLAR